MVCLLITLCVDDLQKKETSQQFPKLRRTHFAQVKPASGCLQSTQVTISSSSTALLFTEKGLYQFFLNIFLKISPTVQGTSCSGDLKILKHKLFSYFRQQVGRSQCFFFVTFAKLLTPKQESRCRSHVPAASAS